jgi:DNA processing protein
VTAQPGDRHVACATLTYLAQPADPLLSRLLRILGPADVLDRIRAGTLPAAATVTLDTAELTRLRPALARWQARLDRIPADAGLARHAANGIHLVCPGDPNWPSQLDDLGPARPYALWVRGTTSLQSMCAQSVAIVGARAATSYGTHICTEITTALSANGHTVISGGAFGIDRYAHSAALAAGGLTIAVLACGPDVPYPAAHRTLLDAIATQGVVISEWPPGTRPAQSQFLPRNRIIAALAHGTVIIEAALRSGALSTGRHAINLSRPLMAVPGPVTSATSAGCHALIHDQGATLVTSAADVLDCLSPVGRSS